MKYVCLPKSQVLQQLLSDQRDLLSYAFSDFFLSCCPALSGRIAHRMLAELAPCAAANAGHFLCKHLEILGSACETAALHYHRRGRVPRTSPAADEFFDQPSLLKSVLLASACWPSRAVCAARIVACSYGSQLTRVHKVLTKFHH